jgi:hypothetical protein
VVGDGERIAVAAVAEFEFALEVGAPEVIGESALREGRALGAVAAAAQSADQAMAVEHGVDGTFGWHAEIAGPAADEQFADFAGAPMWLVAFAADDEGLDLRRQLVGVADRAA